MSSLHHFFPIFFSLDLKGITGRATFSSRFCFLICRRQPHDTTTPRHHLPSLDNPAIPITILTLGISDRCFSVSGWGMTLVSLCIAVLGRHWDTLSDWVVKKVLTILGSLVASPFVRRH